MGTVEIVFRWGDGREEVRYRRPEGTAEANELIAQVEKLQERHGAECPYFWRIA